jgi:hypothetical protein
LWLAETNQQPISQTTWLKVTPNCNHCLFFLVSCSVWPPSLLEAAFFFSIAQLPSLADIAVNPLPLPFAAISYVASLLRILVTSKNDSCRIEPSW